MTQDVTYFYVSNSFHGTLHLAPRFADTALCGETCANQLGWTLSVGSLGRLRNPVCPRCVEFRGEAAE